VTERTTDEVSPTDVADTDIALVGMAGRFPGAADVAELWAELQAGRSGITRFTDEELLGAGVPRDLLADPDYVRAGAVIDGVDRFDAGFFGVNPKEAQILDPQHRLFLEHSWHALEDAGCDPARFDGAIGVFGGCAWSSYLTHNLVPAGVGREVGEMALTLANEKDTLATRVAHLLGLSGPAFTVQSACSTSLVAVCVAASSLANFECDMALAGGVSISVPQRVGYLYQPGGISSPDGECRAFDASGLGAPLGSGVGVVALRRLADALADGDRVYAVLRGWAINNDAGRKVGFTAPGVHGQAAVIAEALAAAGLGPGDLDYVEAHGTGTALGDAAELAALQRVFSGEAVRIGSVKTNLGHLDRAAGVTGLIKTALALHHGEIPPTRNLTEPNPQLTASDAKLTVVTDPWPWPRGDRPRRAGVSAFGIGGTNAHVVIEEAPPRPRSGAFRRPELLVWSARSAAAADQATNRLVGHLQTAGDELADVAHTLRSGRAAFQHRRMLVADSSGTAATLLRDGAARGEVTQGTDRPVGFLITGTGNSRLISELYRDEQVFREEFDGCRAILAELNAGDLPDATVFAAGYALAQLVRSWGIEPSVVVGQGVGEYVAACLSGVLSLRDALALVSNSAPAAAHITSQAPNIPWISGATGQPVPIETVLADEGIVLLQLGPGTSDLASRVLPTMPVEGDPTSAAAALAEAAGRLWLAGAPIDWARYQADRPSRRVTLPGYPFQPERYWIDPPTATPLLEPTTETDAPQVELLTQVWHSVNTADEVSAIGTHHVIVPDSGGVGEALASLLRRAGGEVAVARGVEELAELEGSGGATVVHLSALDHNSAACDEAQVVASVARDLAAVADGWTGTVRVFLVTRGGQAVSGDEPVSPAQASLAVLPVVAGQEYLNLDSRSIDLDPAYDIDDAARALVAELTNPPDTPVTAHRAGQRFLPGYEPISAPARSAADVRYGGSYLITGGLGTVGLLLADHLAARGAARIVLTSRSGLPDDPADPRTTAVARLRAQGIEVLTPRIDVTDPAAMRKLFEEWRIDGVVHAAADSPPSSFMALPETDETAVGRHFGAKVEGARVLAEVLDALPAERGPDWCVLFSSTSALLGGMAFGGYAAANAALTALARGRDRDRDSREPGGTRWIAAAWDTWPGTLERLDGRFGASMAAHAMTEATALAAFDQVLAAGRSALVVAAGGLADRLPAPRVVEQLLPATGAKRFPRPELAQPYVAPLTGTERALAEVWASVLGVEPVGADDSFFELSGNSLLALQMFALVKEQFGTSLPTVSLFELPTVRALAALLDRAAAGTRVPDNTTEESWL
jgi:acyl transferase domain-containing protein/acyl carrier protein